MNLIFTKHNTQARLSFLTPLKKRLLTSIAVLAGFMATPAMAQTKDGCPEVQTVLGTQGAYCATGKGFKVGLLNSEPAVTYTIHEYTEGANPRLSTKFVDHINGNGSGKPNSFSKYLKSGTYKIVATGKKLNGEQCVVEFPDIITINQLAPGVVLAAEGEIVSTKSEFIAGEEVRFTVISNISEGASYKWSITFDGEKWLDQKHNSVAFNINEIPEGMLAVKCEVTPNNTFYPCTNLQRGAFLPLEFQPSAPLPVELMYLRATKQNNNVVLKWATATEKDNLGFDVEVSEDGTNFRKLEFVATKNGNSSVKQEYTYSDTENGKYGTRYYRLKQIDTDGATSYFGGQHVTFDGGVKGVKAFPNPFDKEISFEVEAAKASEMQVVITDRLGKIVLQQVISVGKGAGIYKLPVNVVLPKGLYFVNTQLGGERSNFKLLK